MAEIQGASCIDVRPRARPGTPAEGDWLFLGSPKCSALFAATTTCPASVSPPWAKARARRCPGTRIAWTGNGNPEKCSALAEERRSDSLDSHANRTMRRWEGHLSQAKPWHFYDVEAREVVLPDHDVALVLSPSNAEGYSEWGHRPGDAIGDTTAEHVTRIGLTLLHSSLASSLGWSAALDRLSAT